MGPERRREGEIDLSTGIYISLVLLGRGGGAKVSRVERVDRVKGVGLGPHPQQAGPKIPS